MGAIRAHAVGEDGARGERPLLHEVERARRKRLHAQEGRRRPRAPRLRDEDAGRRVGGRRVRREVLHGVGRRVEAPADEDVVARERIGEARRHVPRERDGAVADGGQRVELRRPDRRVAEQRGVDVALCRRLRIRLGDVEVTVVGGAPAVVQVDVARRVRAFGPAVRDDLMPRHGHADGDAAPEVVADEAEERRVAERRAHDRVRLHVPRVRVDRVLHVRARAAARVEHL